MEDNEQFLSICGIILSLFHYYRGTRSWVESAAYSQEKYVAQALDAFANNREYDPFSFSLSFRNAHDFKYLSFALSEDSLEISEGGSVYDPAVGSDSFTLWEYTLWKTGEESGDLSLNLERAFEMINLGGEIEFEYPWELTNDYLLSKYEREKNFELAETLVDSYERLMSRLAKPIVNRLVGKVKRQLQSYTRGSGMMQSDEDSGLLNVWDEFCVQLQGQESLFFDMYLYTIEGLAMDVLKKCTEDEQIILWTQTQANKQEKDETENENYTDYLKQAYDLTAICQFIVDEVKYEAANYTSKRIADYLY